MLPRRYILSGAEVSEGFAAAQCFPALTPFFSGLPPASGIVPHSLGGSLNGLDPVAREIFRTIAKPEISLRFVISFHDSLVASEARILVDAEGQCVALSRPNASDWDMTLLGDRALALAFVDEMLGCSVREEIHLNFSANLTMAQWAILAAIAQRVRLEEMLAQLEGRAEVLSLLWEPIELAKVQDVLLSEEKRVDPRSPVSHLAALCGVDVFSLGIDLLELGTHALEADGLIDEAQVLTADGLGLVALLKSREAITLIEAARQEAGDVVLDKLVLLHGAGTAFTGVWQADGAGGIDRLALSAISASRLLKLIDLKMGPLILHTDHEIPVLKSGFCEGCGTLYDESPRFCRECGMGL